jgi:hypothetical protein
MQELEPYEEFLEKQLTWLERLADAFTGIDERLDYLNKQIELLRLQFEKLEKLEKMLEMLEKITPAKTIELLEKINDRLDKPLLQAADLEFRIALVNLGKALRWSRIDEFILSFSEGESKEVILSTEDLIWRPNFISIIQDYRKGFDIELWIDRFESEWQVYNAKPLPVVQRDLLTHCHERITNQLFIKAEEKLGIAQDLGLCFYRCVMPKEVEDALEKVYRDYIDFLSVGTAAKNPKIVSTIDPKVKVTLRLGKLKSNSPVLKSYNELKKIAEQEKTNVIEDEYGNKAELLE